MKETNEILTLAVATVLIVGGPVSAQIDYSDFSSVSGLTLVGDAAQFGAGVVNDDGPASWCHASAGLLRRR